MKQVQHFKVNPVWIQLADCSVNRKKKRYETPILQILFKPDLHVV